jgi:transcriptional regulator with XRE-family HTH domain
MIGEIVMDTSKTMAQRLKMLREKKGYKQNFIAEKVGIKSNTLSGYESGARRPDPEILAKLGDIYEVSTDYIIGRTDDPRVKEDGEMYFFDLENVTPEEIEEAKRYIKVRRQMQKKDKDN